MPTGSRKPILEVAILFLISKDSARPWSYVVSAAFSFKNASRSKFLSSGSVITVKLMSAFVSSRQRAADLLHQQSLNLGAVSFWSTPALLSRSRILDFGILWRRGELCWSRLLFVDVRIHRIRRPVELTTAEPEEVLEKIVSSFVVSFGASRNVGSDVHSLPEKPTWLGQPVPERLGVAHDRFV